MSRSHIPLVTRAEQHAHSAPRSLALRDAGSALTYAELLAESERAACLLLERCANAVNGRVALLAPGSSDYVVAQWSIWRAGAACVPLCITHPAPELAYVLDDADVVAVIAHPELAAKVEALASARNIPLLLTTELRAASARAAALPDVARDAMALILYTSGTTGKPKGVVTTHAILEAQIEAVVKGWELCERDQLAHVLPLHHLHGILNALCAPLYAGATCELLPRFDADELWELFIERETLTLFMGVPTMYSKLAQRWDAAPADRRAVMSAALARLRLMVSGSAALPVAMLERWRAISGHTLLERYGMTELGMVLGNPLHGPRLAGHVGVPFPDVETRLVDEAGSTVADDQPGEIQVRGPNVFREYWRKPDATRAAFTSDGFFRTGDVAVRRGNVHRILGRESVDILKTGGFKVSALEIEDVLRTHPAILDCAVVGIADEEWGQRVAVAIELRASPGVGRTGGVETPDLTLAELREWGKERLAPYKVPTLLHVAEQLPRNALGKVLKPEVARLFANRD